MAISNLPTLEIRKQIEDKITPILDWSDLELSILYYALRARGYNSDGLKYRIDQMLIAESHKG